MVIFETTQCPIEDCECHTRLIKAPVKALEDHLFFDHGYATKKEKAEQLGIIRIGQTPSLTARELARALAKKGIVK